MKFPKNFTWGAAAASYQIEGASCEDGKGLSIWDVFSREPGKVFEGNAGDGGTDHYYHWKEDVSIMRDIGLNAYRMSVSWPRIIPDGTGAVNKKGVAFYDKLIDALLDAGVEPWVTLFHWDYPYELHLRGGWLNRESAAWFADYARVVVEKFSDRVTHWIPQNEPQCYIGLGYNDGEHAPGLKCCFRDILHACHNSHIAHGMAVQAIRAHAKKKPLVGTAIVGAIKTPATDSKKDVEAARAATFAVSAKNCWNNTWFSDPIIYGKYPADGLELFKNEMPEIKSGDMKTMAQPLDFYGVNIYMGRPVRAKEGGGWEEVPPSPGHAFTTMGWKVTPDVLYWGPKFLYERYKLPIVITENGMAGTDWVHMDGKVHDAHRIDFLSRYIGAFGRSIADGVDGRGYFVWSILDNFEWAFGYKQRFGLVHIDYTTGKRTLKDSAHWYREVVKSNGKCL